MYLKMTKKWIFCLFLFFKKSIDFFCDIQPSKTKAFLEGNKLNILFELYYKYWFRRVRLSHSEELFFNYQLSTTTSFLHYKHDRTSQEILYISNPLEECNILLVSL